MLYDILIFMTAVHDLIMKKKGNNSAPHCSMFITGLSKTLQILDKKKSKLTAHF